MASVLTFGEGAMERRLVPRVTARGGHWLSAARVWPGRDVSVVNVSASGVLIEGDARLIPGMHIELQLAHPGGRLLVSGRVLRCYVSALTPAGGVSYRGAVMFEQPLPVAMPAGIGAG